MQLAGECELNGIVLVNRYEFSPDHEEFRWAVPRTVSFSLDGKAWTTVATIPEARVRIERMPAADGTKPPG